MPDKIQYSYGLDFSDVLEYIPMLTIYNQVKSDGKILHLQISYCKKILHLFIDTKTKEYCFNSSNNQDENDLLYEIGDIVLSKYHHYKDDLEALIVYIQKSLTVCEAA